MQLPPVSPAPAVDSQTWRTLSVGHRRRNNIKSTGIYNYEHNKRAECPQRYFHRSNIRFTDGREWRNKLQTVVSRKYPTGDELKWFLKKKGGS